MHLKLPLLQQLMKLLFLVGILVTTAASLAPRRGEHHHNAYCAPPSPLHLSDTDPTDEPQYSVCHRHHPAEALWRIHRLQSTSSAVCNDDIESDIVSMVYENTIQWLSLNATVFEAPSILENLMHRKLESAQDDLIRSRGESTHVQETDVLLEGDDLQTESQKIFDNVDWKHMHRLDSHFKNSRIMVSLHVSSAYASEQVKRRLQQVHLQAVHDFESRKKGVLHATSLRSPLSVAVEHFFPDGVPAFERHWPHQMSLPTFISYQYSTKQCKTCSQGLAAFHRLEDTFSYLCTKDQRAVASCHPVTYFIAFPVDTFLSVVPQVSLTKHPLIHTNPSSGERKESRRAQRVTDTMGPFSYYLEHTSLMNDYLSFLVVNEVLQLRFLSADEASELRRKLRDIQQKRHEVELRVAKTPPMLPSNSSESDAEKSADNEDGENALEVLKNITESRKELQRLRDAEQRTGKVRSIQEMLVLVIRAMEAGISEEDEVATQEQRDALKPYVRWYAFPSPWPKERQDSDDSSEATGLLGSKLAFLCDILSCAWIAMIGWVAVHGAIQKQRASGREQ